MRPLRVLVVEDQEDDARLLLMELKRAGWEVAYERVQQAQTMLEAIDAHCWDIIISDYSMPQFSGLAALDLVRKRGIDLPFILISGTMGEEIAVEAMRAGANDYLFKGNLKRLGPAIERELREAQGRKEARGVAHELKKRERQLADARRMARLGSWHLDLEMQVLVFSEEVHRVLNHKAGGVSMGFDEFLNCLHPDDRQVFTQSLNAADVNQLAQDCRIVLPDGAVRFAHIRGDIIRDTQGNPMQAAGMIQDVTDRKLAEADLRTALDALAVAKEAAEAANHAKDNFLAILSHELRTPLTPVLALVSQMQSEMELPCELRDDLGTIRRNVEMEARLIDDLLDLTRIVRCKMELHQEVTDVHAAAQGAVELFQKEIDAKGLELTVDLRAAKHHAWADPARLRQVFMNLLSNAVKFTLPGGKISVASSVDASGSIQLQFADNGIGIEAETLPRLFRHFEQGERTVTRRFGGLGLGLSIAASLVDMHGGTLSADSAGKNQGATFTLTLATVPEAQSPSSPESDSPAQAPLSCRILLVEDDKDTRLVVTRLLSRLGCVVTPTASVHEAIATADKQPFDLLLSDIGLPDGTGLEVMRHVRVHCSIPGIAVSGFGQEEDIRRSEDAGFSIHLTKPINFDRLKETIRKLVRPAVASSVPGPP